MHRDVRSPVLVVSVNFPVFEMFTDFEYYPVARYLD